MRSILIQFVNNPYCNVRLGKRSSVFHHFRGVRKRRDRSEGNREGKGGIDSLSLNFFVSFCAVRGCFEDIPRLLPLASGKGGVGGRNSAFYYAALPLRRSSAAAKLPVFLWLLLFVCRFVL